MHTDLAPCELSLQHVAGIVASMFVITLVLTGMFMLLFGWWERRR